MEERVKDVWLNGTARGSQNVGSFEYAPKKNVNIITTNSEYVLSKFTNLTTNFTCYVRGKWHAPWHWKELPRVKGSHNAKRLRGIAYGTKKGKEKVIFAKLMFRNIGK